MRVLSECLSITSRGRRPYPARYLSSAQGIHSISIMVLGQRRLGSGRRLDVVLAHLAAAPLSGPERVAELVITLMLAEGREERREALLKLERQLDRCTEADAEAAMNDMIDADGGGGGSPGRACR